jgi:hypothetical protein
MHRRELLLSGAVAGAALFSERAFAQAAGGKVIPWSDQPASVPPQVENVIEGLTRWEDLDTQITPNNRVLLDRPLQSAADRHQDMAARYRRASGPSHPADPGQVEGDAA